MKRMGIIFAIAVCAAGACFISCTSDNPLEPVIREIWGDYDYVPYGQGYSWAYNVNVPQDTVSYNMSYHVTGREFHDPYNAWKIDVLFEWILIGYQYVAKTDHGIHYLAPYTDEWSLFHRFPFVVGNTWSGTATVTDRDSIIFYRFNVSGEVIGREEVSVRAGTYQYCAVVREVETYTALNPIYEDSNYYYRKKLWFAPNVGVVKLEITDSNFEYMVGYTESLNEFKKASASSLNDRDGAGQDVVLPRGLKKLYSRIW